MKFGLTQAKINTLQFRDIAAICPEGTLRNIIKQAGLTVDEFIELL